ncbi:MAG TPA: hypothetical protein VFC03_08625 [Acidimicrobiales bacterium]|nr:hypothetical protein [Acidimicrobiales bacterium]
MAQSSPKSLRIVSVGSPELLGWLTFWARDDDALWPSRQSLDQGDRLLNDLRAGVRPGPRIAWSNEQLNTLSNWIEPRRGQFLDHLKRSADTWHSAATNKHNMSSPSGELAPLTADEFCTLFREERTEHVQVVVVCTYEWQSTVAHLLPLVAELFHHLSVGVTLIRVTQDSEAGILGDTCAELFEHEDNTYVCVNGGAGSAEERRPLEFLAAAWNIPIAAMGTRGSLLAETTRPTVSSAVLLTAMSIALTADNSEAVIDRVTRGGLDVFVKPDPQVAAGLLPTRSLSELFGCIRFSEQDAGRNSSSAALLDRLGLQGEEYAQKLRSLIDHWVQQRIWTVNYVHEMVLHDEAHSASVDRHIAMLCEPLIEDQVITPYDLYVLAISAWLHDWGHASTKVGGQIPTDPIEVRLYHGPLTALKIFNEGSARHGLEGVVADEVSLLSAHHQGWTSADSQQPRWPKPRKVFQINSNTNLGPYEKTRIGSFDSEANAYGLVSKPVELVRLHRLLALLRIADAMDIGAHRVPHSDTQHEFRSGLLPAHLNVAYQILAASGLAQDIRDLMQVQSLYSAIMGSLQTDHRHTFREKEIDKIIELKGRGGLPQLFLDEDEEPADRSALWKLGVDAWDFAKHLCRQSSYFRLHERVQAVFPMFVKRGDGKRTLVIRVMTTERCELSDREPVRQEVQDLVNRELGWSTPDDDEENEKEVKRDEKKMAIEVWLRGLGIVGEVMVELVPLTLLKPELVERPAVELGPVSPTCWSQLAGNSRSWRLELSSGGLDAVRLDNPTDDANECFSTDSMAVSADGTVAARLTQLGLTVSSIRKSTDSLAIRDRATAQLPWLANGREPSRLLAVAKRGDTGARVVISTMSTTYTMDIDLSTAEVSQYQVRDEPSRSAVLMNSGSWTVALDGTIREDRLKELFQEFDRVSILDAKIFSGVIVLACVGVNPKGWLLKAVRLTRGLDQIGAAVISDLGEPANGLCVVRSWRHGSGSDCVLSSHGLRVTALTIPLGAPK